MKENRKNKKINIHMPAKHLCYLYFFIPIIVCALTQFNKEGDIWFLLNHGEYVLNHGFPIIEPFTIHQNFSFVMQQWLSAVIFYIAYSLLKQYGLIIVIEVVACLLLYFLYKLCMVLTEEKVELSIIFSCITVLFLSIFFVPRPWIFTFLILVIVLYIMELFYKKNKEKALYFLPLLSILQINFQSSMWFMLFLFILPYFVCLFYKYLKNRKDKRFYKLLIAIIIMFIVGFINPYGIKNILYVFNSYGNEYINKVVIEMYPSVLGSNAPYGIYGKLTFFLLFIIVGIYIFYKDGKLEIRHMLLLFGVSILALLNIRSIGLLIIGGIPFLSSYLKDLFITEDNSTKIEGAYKKDYILVVIILMLFTISSCIIFQKNFKYDLEKGIDTLLKENKKENIVMYTGYNTGSYVEYRGIKCYLDTRAEVFLKSNNKQQDIMKEYYLLISGNLDYKWFVNKYKFTHLLVTRKDKMYQYLIKDDNYKIIYHDKKYVIFEKLYK